MRRVIVESPFAPQTPIAAEVCPWEKDGFLGCYNVGSPGAKYDQYRPCPRCASLLIRAGELARNARYLAAALRDCVLRGESPYASHGLLTLPGVLRDDVPEERARGIAAGFAWREAAHASVFYVDLGWSSGMRAGEADALRVRNEIGLYIGGHVVEERSLGPDWDKR